MLDFFKGTVTPGDWMFVGIVLGITALLCAGFYFVILKGQNEDLAAEIKNVETINGQLEVAEYIDDNFDEFQLKMKKMEELVMGFQERLPEEREIGRLIGSFEQQGAELNLAISLDPQTKLTDTTKVTYPYKVTVQGDYHDIVTFINLFERAERYIKVTNLDFEEQELVDGKPMTTASFTLSTYVFTQEAA